MEKSLTIRYGDIEKDLTGKELTEQERQIIEKLFYSSEDSHLHHPSDQLLYDLLINEKEIPQSEWSRPLTFPVRFIYVLFNKVIEDRKEFAEAMQALFPGSHTFLWRTQKEGFLIQEVDEQFEAEVKISSIIDTLAADFFTRPTIFIGSFIQHPADMKHHTDWESRLFHDTADSFPKKHLFLEQELSLFYLLSRFSRKSLDDVSRIIAPVKEDHVLLESILCYLEANMNTTLAAKQMYMHRNTMQYRVDKFIEKTSVDIKQFPNAVSVYLMLLAHPALYKED
jgi:sugar diacid utilization regulator